MKKMNTKDNAGRMSTNYPLLASYLTLTCPLHAYRSIVYFFAVFAMLLLGGWSNEIFGATLTAKVAVGSGKGTAKVEIYNGYGQQKGSTSSSSSEVKTISFGMSYVNWAYSKYSASASTGYTFEAWYTNQACTNGKQTANPYETSTSRNSARTDQYWAKFTPNKYTVKFDANTGSGSMSNMSFTYDVAQNLTTNTFTKTGYTFSGWNTKANGTGTVYADGANVSNLTSTNNGTVTLYAQWTANTYYVAFNGNGSTSGSMSNQTFTYDATAQLSAFSSIKREYIVTFDANGGSKPASATAIYSFVKWNTKADGTGTVYANQASVKNLATSGTFNLYAQWNSGSVTLPNATKTGGVLDAWYYDDTRIGEAGEPYTPTANVTLTAHWIDKYTPEFGGSDRSMEVGDELSDAFTFEHTDHPTVHISNTNVISYDAPSNTVKALSEGTAEIYFVQEGTSTLLPKTSDTWTFTVSRKANTLALTSNSATKYVGEEVTGVITDKNSDATIETSSTDATIAYYDVAQNKIVIPNSGAKSFNSTEVTIKIWQAQNVQYTASGEKTFTLTVNKRTPSFSVNKTSLELEQTATLTMNNVDGASVSIDKEGVISYANGTITGIGLGTATLTVTQAETKALNAKQQSFTFTIGKKTPTLTVKMDGVARTSMSVNRGTTVSVTFEKTSDAEVVVTPVSGSQYASYVNGVMTAGVAGTATYRASLAETATNKSAYVDFTLEVTTGNTHLPISITSQAAYNALKSGSSGDNEWKGDEGFCVGGYNGWLEGVANWDDKYVTFKFEGVPNKLTFDYKFIYRDNILNKMTATPPGGSTVEGQLYFIYVDESADGSTWSAVMNDQSIDKDNWKSYNKTLKKTTRYIRFHLHANYGALFKNIKVSELKYVEDPDPDTIDFGSDVINAGEKSKTSLINWCNIAPLSVICDNPRFTVKPVSFGNFDTYATQTLTVKYTHTNEAGTNEGDITISNGDATYTKTIHVTAITTKRPQTITWNTELAATGFAMNVGEQYPDETITTIANATSKGAVTFTSDNSDIIEVIDDTKLLAKGTGKVNITAHQAGDTEYQAVSDTKEFTVTQLLKQSITWEQNLYGLLTTSNPLTLTATATSGGDITYASADKNVVKVEGNVLTVVGEGETYITATQAGGTIGGSEWLAVSQDNYVIVRNPNSQCNGMALSQGSLTLNNTEREFALSGIPQVLTFTAKHGEKSALWGTAPSYAPLIVEQYAFKNNQWDWFEVYNKVTGTGNTASGNISLDESATKIRISTIESGTDYTVSNIRVTRKKFMRSDVASIGENVESNAAWQATITISHSNIDLMTVTTKKGLLALSKSTLGEGCGDFGDDAFTVSYTPMDKNVDYKDTIVITDGKAEPSIIEIPVRLHSVGLNQTININEFDVPETALTTDLIGPFTATATSELPVTYAVSDENIARIIDGNKVEFLSYGTVDIIAKQEGNGKFNPAQEIHKTIEVSKAEPAFITYPTGTSVPYLGTLSGSVLSGGLLTVTLRGVADTEVEGTFTWKYPDTQITESAGNHSYPVIFTPSDTKMYLSKEANIEIEITRIPQSITMNNGTVRVTVEGVDAADSKLDLTTLIDKQTNDAGHTGAVSFALTGDNAAYATISNEKIFSATAGGTYTLLATKAQTDYYEQATASFTVTVTRRANTLAPKTNYEQYVDDEVDGVVASTKNSNGTIHASSSDATIAYYDVEHDAIYIPNSEAKSFTSKTVTLKIWQDVTDQFEASGEKTITLKVNKYANDLYCSWGANTWSQNLNFDEKVRVTFSANNKVTPIVITQTSGNTSGQVVASYSAEKDSIYSYWNIGTATWTIEQEENYKYVASATKTVTIRVDKLDETCYVLNDPSEYEIGTIGTNAPLALSASGRQLTFEARQTVGSLSDLDIQYSTNGAEFQNLRSVNLTASWKEYGPYDIPEAATHIRFKTEVGATFVKHYRNIQITRRESFKIVDKEGAEISTLEMPMNVISAKEGVANSSSAKFYVDYNVCADEIKVASNHGHFTVSESAFSTVDGEGRGVKEITITYTCADYEDTHATITVYTPFDHKTLTVHGRTDKQSQEIVWANDFQKEPVTLSLGYTTGAAATATSEMPVKYSVAEGEESIIEIANDGYYFTVIGEGTVHLTATQEGNKAWYPASSTKEIYATGKKIQVIQWIQDLTYSLQPDDNVELLAEVHIRNMQTGTHTKDDARTALIQYSCPAGNGVIEILDNKTLHVLGYGTTTITASVDGNEYYKEASPVTLQVEVHEASTGCPDPLMINKTDMIELFSMNIDWGFSDGVTPAIIGNELPIDLTAGKPDKLSFQHEGEKYIAPVIKTEHYKGYIKAQQHVAGDWIDVAGSRVEPTVSVWNEINDLQLNPNADAIRFVREANGMGYHHISNVRVTMQSYLSTDEPVVDLGTLQIGTVLEATLDIEYANVKGTLLATRETEEDIFTLGVSAIYPDCGSVGKYEWPIRFAPTTKGEWQNKVTITDELTGREVVFTVKANVIPGAMFIFETEGEWGDESKWNKEELPGADDYVIIAQDVTIPKDADVTVKTLAINEGVTVNVEGNLTVLESTPGLENHGNLHVAKEGNVNLDAIATGGLKVNNFTLDAALGNISNTGYSGQVTNAEKLIVTGDAYFQMSLDPSGSITYGWYDFVVPFEVDVLDGISIVGNTIPLKFNVNYAVMDNSEAKRAVNGKDWNKFRGTMLPGRVYTITLDDEHPEWNTVLFKKKDGVSVTGDRSYTTEYTAEGETKDRGWNGFGNGTLQHAELNVSDNQKIQIYDHSKFRFEPHDAKDYSIAVGTSFFMQFGGVQTVELLAAEGNDKFLAPARERRATEEFRLALTAEGEEHASDRLWVSASEEATGAYVIGHDLLKMGTPAEAKVAQMWANNAGNRLCDIEMPLNGDGARCELGLFAPQENSYTLSVEKAPEDVTLYLTFNDRPIWNLSMSPYVLDLTNGTTEGYGLQLYVRPASEVATGVDEVQGDNVPCTKVLMDGKMYIIAPEGAIFDATGKKVK